MGSLVKFLLLASVLCGLRADDHPSLPPFVNEIIDDVEDESPKMVPEPELSTTVPILTLRCPLTHFPPTQPLVTSTVATIS